MSYAIVAFDGEDDDATVDVVPTNWLDKDDRCYWAPYPTAKFIAAVKSRQEPEASWSTYRAKVLKSYGIFHFLQLPSVCYIVKMYWMNNGLTCNFRY